MKHLKKILCLALTICFFCSLMPAFGQESADQDPQALPITISRQEIKASEDSGDGKSSYVRYPVLEALDASYAPAVDQINRAIQEKAHISSYIQLLSSLAPGGTGLQMDYSMGIAASAADGREMRIDGWVLSLLFSAEGKMLTGRPSHVYYPMTFDLRTGEEITFDELFADPEGAKGFMEARLEEEVEPSLSTHLENNQLFPVPFERFFLDSFGRVIILYENSQLSFLSGRSGAVSFRSSQLMPWMDESKAGIMAQLPWQRYILSQPPQQRAEALWAWLENGACLIPADRIVSLSEAFSSALEDFHITADSGFYPGGAYYEVEEPAFRGALILTDENEEKVTGILAGQLDLFDIQTGKTTLEEAKTILSRKNGMQIELNEAAAEIYRVCPGTALVYPLERKEDGVPMTFTVYADQDGIVQYLKLSL